MSIGPESHVDLKKINRVGIGQALAKIPQGVWVLTAAYEQRIRALMVSWVQQVSFEPPMVMVSLRKGRDIVPLLHDGHSFCLNQIHSDDRLSIKRFGENPQSDERLLGVETLRKATGAPVIARAMAFMDCELIRHIDIEGDHDMYVGLILDGGVLHEGNVPVHLRDSGWKY
jgi:flavin reductase (DIM6/NTAB) family NADH-FMN oxidoreductase RutF